MPTDRSLWPGPPRADRRPWWPLYLGVPTVLCALWGGDDLVRDWLAAFVATAAIGGCVQGGYTLAARWPPPIPRLVTHGLVMSVGTAAGAALAAGALASIWGVPAEQSLPSLLRIGAVVTGLVVGFVWIAEGWRARLVAAELGEARARQATLLAELRAIQARTQPHFLLNSLNVVSALVETEPSRAEEVLGQLASLFQYALRAGERQTLPLEEELAAVQDYLAVEVARFGDRLAWSVHATDEAKLRELPPLSVQLLVENAVSHGVSPRPGPGRVTVWAEVLASGRLRVTVEDDGVGLGASPRPGNGFGLASLRERLRLLYGDDAVLDVGAADPRGVIAVMEVP